MIEHGSAQQVLADDDLTNAIDRASRTISTIPLAIILAILAALGTFVLMQRVLRPGTPMLVTLGGTILCFGIVLSAIGIMAWSIRRDRSKRIRLEYEMDARAEARWRDLGQSVNSLVQTSSEVVRAGAEVTNFKYHAGAGRLVDTSKLLVSRHRTIQFVDSNVNIPALEPARGVVYRLLPDRILCWSHGQMGVIHYRDIQFECGKSTLIQDRAPHDGRVVGHAWKHPNRDGGPDRRFSNNYQLPIVEYCTVRMRTAGAMDHALLIANESAAKAFVDAIRAMAAQPPPNILPLLTQTPEPKEESLPNLAPSLAASHPALTPHEENQVATETDRINVFETILDAFCCVMFADMQAVEAERLKVQELMRRVRSPWNDADVEQGMRRFCEIGKSVGLETMLDRTCKRLRNITDPRQQDVLKRCLKEVAESDGRIGAREDRVSRKLLSAFRSDVDA